LTEGIFNDSQRQETSHHAQLRAKYPRPALAHGQELEMIHQRADQEFKCPRQRDDAKEGSDLHCRHAGKRQPGRQCNVHETGGDSLGKIRHSAGGVAHVGAMGEDHGKLGRHYVQSGGAISFTVYA
jgi:hypothetical protein